MIKLPSHLSSTIAALPPPASLSHALLPSISVEACDSLERSALPSNRSSNYGEITLQRTLRRTLKLNLSYLIFVISNFLDIVTGQRRHGRRIQSNHVIRKISSPRRFPSSRRETVCTRGTRERRWRLPTGAGGAVLSLAEHFRRSFCTLLHYLRVAFGENARSFANLS